MTDSPIFDQLMTSRPHWQPVDEQAADLLSLIADDQHPSVDYEWDVFREAVDLVATHDGLVSQNTMRTILRGKIAPRRIGPFYRRACSEGWLQVLIGPDGRACYESSDDTEGRNSGRPVRLYVKRGRAA